MFGLPYYARLLAVSALALLASSVCSWQSALGDDAADRQRTAERDRQWRDELAPQLKNFCFDCHAGEKVEGGVQLGKTRNSHDILTTRKMWQAVIGKIQSKEMPPADHQPQPSDAERTHLVQWLTEAVNNLNCNGSPDPGRVTLRRLNRREYRATVRDLIGIDYEPSQEFPGDDVGYGFDNIGDVLSLPPILLEKYLAAAEAITTQAIDANGGKMPLDKLQIGALLEGAGNKTGLLSRLFTSEGEAFFKLDVPLTGQYEIRILAWGDQAGDEPCKMGVRLDGDERKIFDVPEREKEAHEFSFQTELQGGNRRIAVAFLNDKYLPNDPDPTRRDRNLIVTHVRIRGPLESTELQVSEIHKKLVTARPGGKTTRREATEKVLRPLASKAFRRPVTENEIDRLLKIAEQSRREGDTYEQSLQLALQAILISPHFIYRVELDPVGKEGQPRTLSDYELATRLSYFLWSSLPDDELFRLAAEGKLRSDGNLEKQVRRMLADAKSQALVENFGSQWLELRSLDIRTPDAKQFPEYSPALRTAMRTETEMLLQTIVKEDRSVTDLLSADFTFLNEPLAKLYKIDGVSGNEFRRVSLQGTARGGLLTQASILTITSNPNRTSPVKRGKWILDNILGTPPPPPPANVPELTEPKKGEKLGTLRQRMEQHRSNPICASCHQRMDPLGFALENFDPIGRLRETDDGQPIDISGKLPSGEEFKGAAELREILLKTRQTEFIECLTEKLLTYALGRGLEYQDTCAVEAMMKQTRADGNKFSRIVLGIVESSPFQNVGAKRNENHE